MNDEYKVGIDGSEAESGSDRVVKSFEQIKNAASRMEKTATTAFERLRKAFQALSGAEAPINKIARATAIEKAANNLKILSEAVAGIKAPSAATTANLDKFFKVLDKNSNFNSPKVGSLKSFLAAMNGYKGPSPTAARNTSSLLTALSKSPTVGATGGLIKVMQALSQYRGPGKNAGVNTLNLVNALNRIQYNGNIKKLAADIVRLGQGLEMASRSASKLNGAMKFSFNSKAIATNRKEIDGLTRQYNFLETSIYRTQTAFNVLGGVLGIRLIAQASNEIIKLRAQLEAATGSAQQGRIQFAFLEETTQRLGLQLVETGRSYGLLLGSLKGTGITFQQTQEIFEGFATAARALQLSGPDVEGVFRALGQILSKGKLQAEELRGQLGDRLPGAFVRFAQALKLTKPGELDDALKRGAISGDRLKNAIFEVARTLRDEFAVSASKAAQTVDAAFNRLQNQAKLAADEFGRAGFNDALIKLADSLTGVLRSQPAVDLMRALGSVLKFVADNLDVVAVALSFFITTSALKFLGSVGKMTGVSRQLGGAFKGLAAAADFAWIIAGTLSMGKFSTAANIAKGAFLAFARVIVLNPVGAAITAIGLAVAGLTFYLMRNREELSKSEKEVQSYYNSMSTGSALAKNAAEEFEKTLLDSTKRLDEDTEAWKRNTLEILRNANARGASSNVSITPAGSPEAYISGSGASFGPLRGLEGLLNKINPKTTKQASLTVGGISIVGDKTLTDLVKRNFTVGRDGRTVSTQLRTPDQAIARLGDSGRLLSKSAFVDPDLAQALVKTSTDLANEVEVFVRLQRQIGTPEALAAADKVQAVIDRQGRAAAGAAVISGDVEEKDPAGGRSAVRAFEGDLRRGVDSALELIRDTVATRRSASVIQGSSNSLEAQATLAAGRRVTDLERSFEDPQKRAAGLAAISRQLESNSETAKLATESLEQYFTRLELGKLQAQKELDINEQVRAIDESLGLQQGLVEATVIGGDALRKATIQYEVQKELIGVSATKYDELYQKLLKSRLEQDKMNQALEAAAELNSIRNESRDLQIQTTLSGAGLSSRELELNLELARQIEAAYQNMPSFAPMLEQGYIALTKQKFAALELQDEFERLAQLSQDIADILSQGLVDALDSGKNFGDIMKGIFNDLKRTFLQTFIGDPFREAIVQASQRRFSAGLDTSVANGAAFDTRSITNDLKVDLVPVLESSLAAVLAPIASMSFDKKRQIAFQDTIEEGSKDALIVTSGPLAETQAKKIVREQDRSPSRLKELFNYEKNFTGLKDSFSKLGQKGKFAEGAAGLGQAAGTAIAAFSIGKSVGNLTGNEAVGNILGGAAAGYSIGGPVGAVVGAVAGGIFSALKKTPSASTDVTVGADGIAQVGRTRRTGKGDRAGAMKLGEAGASLFNDFATQFEATLQSGNYGTFGIRKKEKFYSATGNLRKGKPRGVEGVDYIYGDDSELQAFALKSQIRAGRFQGLDPVYDTIGRNSRAKTIEDLEQDFEVGKAYLDFIEASKVMTSLQKEVQDLNKNYEQLRKTSKALGLDEERLAKARQKLLDRYRDDFDFDVSQEILSITDPIRAEYNQLLKDYENTVANAVAVGGNLTEVERLYGLKRLEILKNSSEQANDALAKSASDLLTSLTSTSNSPLGAGQVFSNAQNQFSNLAAEIQGGDLSRSDKLAEFARNYLDSARNLFASSTTYFSIFDNVTAFLREVEAGVYSQTTSPVGSTTLPELPGVSEIVKKIEESNNELAEINKEIAVESASAASTLNQYLPPMLQAILDYQKNSTPGLEDLLRGSGGYFSSGVKLL